MITSLRLVNFKNFADETLRVGPFTVIVGANASGKSNIRDAFRFLHGIGRGYTLAEIMGGKHGDGGYVEWTGIRGAPNEVVRFEPRFPHQSSTFSVQVEIDLSGERLFYFIKVGFDPTSGFVLLEEKLRTASETIYAVNLTDGPGIKTFENPVTGGSYGLNKSEPALAQIDRRYQLHDIKDLLALTVLLGNIRFMELSSERMREPSLPGAHVLSDSGQNLPTVLEAICADPTRKSILMSWLQELTPMDIDGFAFPRDPSGRVHLQVCERNGRTVSAYSVSDGTLRFVAMLAALLSYDSSGIYFFEEFDSGIHPNRLWLLLELIEKQTEKNDTQVIVTTHSPDLLNYISDQTFKNTSVVSRLQETDDAIIRPLNSLHNVKELRKSQGLGRLHSSGWMEDILNLEAWKNEDDEARG